MPRGKRTNVALICEETGETNYVIRLIKDTIKNFSAKKYCPRLRRRTVHKAKEIKGGY